MSLRRARAGLTSVTGVTSAAAGAVAAAILFCAATAFAEIPLPKVQVAAPAPPPAAAAAAASAIVQRRGEGVHFDLHKEDAKALFDVSAQKFHRSMEVGKLRDQVQAIAAQKKAVSPGELEQLKLVRKDGNILRSSFVLFDKQHEPPKKLDALVTNFGKMNDALAAGNDKQSAHYARKVLKSLDARAIKHDVSSFSPSSHKSFEKEMDEQRSSLSASLEKRTVLAPEFHAMRKSLTKVLAIFSLVPEVRQDPALEKLYQKVFTVQTDMGTMHDEVTAKAINGKLDYETYAVSIPPPMKQALHEILDSLK